MQSFQRVALRALLLSSLALPGVAHAQQAAPSDEEIVVTGQRAAQRRSIEQKRDADNMIEGLSADDAGKLPDQNVSESVRRLPGVTVTNDQGEGRYVVIRGVNPNLANVTINGQTAAAPEPDARQVKLDDIPAALIGSVQVVKSLTPNLDANAIAGQVSINTLGAFDREGFFLNARGVYGYSDLNGANPYEGDVTLGGRLSDEFGAVLSANFSHRPIRSENVQGSSNWRAINGFIVPDDFRPRDYNLERERTGLVANFDWRPDPNVSLYLRTTYSEFTDSETRDQWRYAPPTANYTGQTATSGTITTGGRVTRFVRRREEDDTTLNVAAGGHFNHIGPGELTAEVGYTRAEKTDPLRSEYQFRTGTNIGATYNLSQELFRFDPAPAAFVASNFAFNAVNYDRREAVETLWQGRLDYSMPVSLGDAGELQFGFKITDRNKTNERDLRAYVPAGAGLNLSAVSYIGDLTTFDGAFTIGPRINYNAAEAFFAANPGNRALDLAGSVPNSLTNDYEASERVMAGYVMATLHFGDLTIIPGVRVEHTSGDYSAKAFTATSSLTQPFNVFADDSYTDFFPGVNMRYDLNDQVVFRAAATTALGRPNYYDVVPTINVDTGANSVTMGNPNLEPLHAINLDGAVEYYPTEDSIFALGVFYKHISDPIYLSSTTQTGTFAGQSLTNALVTQPFNAESAYVFGFELNAQSQFTFLPGFWGGFGVGVNFTWTTSEAEGLSGRPDTVPLFQQAPTVATAQIFYEKYGITGRVAYSYRNAFLDTVGASQAGDIYTDQLGQLDARLAYDLNDHAQIFVEGTNLNDATFRRYIGIQNQTVETEHYEWSTRTGFALKF